ncbi:MAG: hypothetical protein PVH88_26800 [Ignavibacteria bacterium]|jgi:hypothetical protein
MKNLNFNPFKSTEDFRKNYQLHDAAENTGKNLLTQWGIIFNPFGEDKRYSKVWEKGEDKPDLIISYKNKPAFLDWKGKRKNKWLVNERAIKSYKAWSEKFNVPVIIVFFVFNESMELTGRKFALVGNHSYKQSAEKQWDKNRTVEFQFELPDFNKANFINTLLMNNNFSFEISG